MPACPAALPDASTAARPCAGSGRAMLAAGMAVFKGARRAFPGRFLDTLPAECPCPVANADVGS